MASTSQSRLFIDLSSALRTITSFLFFASTIIYFSVMVRRKVFHSNLHLILLASPFSFIVILLPNMLKDVLQWFVPFSEKDSETTMMIVDIGQFSAGYNLLVLITERAIATVFVAKYEHLCAKLPWFAIGLVVAQWTSSFILLYLNYNGEVVSSVALVTSIVVGCSLAVAVFTFLPRISDRAYNREHLRSQGTIERYQASENKKSSRVLRNLVMCTVAAVILMLSIYCYIRFAVEKSMRDASFNLHFSVVAICATILNGVVLVSHSSLRKELVRFTRTERWFGRKKGVQTVMVTSLSGQRLNIPTAEQGAAYFGAYQSLWNG